MIATLATHDKRLRERVDRLQEAVDVSLDKDSSGQSLLRGRVKRLEEAVGEIYEAQAMMDQSLRVQSLAALKIKRALGDVISDISELVSLSGPSA